MAPTQPHMVRVRMLQTVLTRDGRYLEGEHYLLQPALAEAFADAGIALVAPIARVRPQDRPDAARGG